MFGMYCLNDVTQVNFNRNRMVDKIYQHNKWLRQQGEKEAQKMQKAAERKAIYEKEQAEAQPLKAEEGKQVVKGSGSKAEAPKATAMESDQEPSAG
jgi:hypothetical protein